MDAAAAAREHAYARRDGEESFRDEVGAAAAGRGASRSDGESSLGGREGGRESTSDRSGDGSEEPKAERRDVAVRVDGEDGASSDIDKSDSSREGRSASFRCSNDEREKSMRLEVREGCRACFGCCFLMRSVFRSCAARSAFFARRAAPSLAWRSAAALASFSAAWHLRFSAGPAAYAFCLSAFRRTSSARDCSIRRE